MSLINEYRATEQAIKELQQRLEDMGNNDALKVEMKFEEELRVLMTEFGKNLGDIIGLLDPDRAKRSPTARPPAKTRRERVVSVYSNPHTGEKIETKGGNHKRLKEWKSEYGAENVEAWRHPAQV
ncbi:histone-like nucleoid-structuring protein, MvaT/MvaU family [Pseudomonas sp. Irchel 3E13]|uniref:histone-like nucleoid-structuring protein, MvaT/MvaU family n=1 Tax=Pseudomonas sp. Irchel 3E13 TaxID=2008975 RepID=UPI000BA3E31D|nr:histone-like nucleoid-structuring protein, MvaT/MvaU family [Pseudomonas sp. Irchel 3E13]